VESSNSIRTRFLELTSFDTGGLGWPTGCAGLERAVRKKKRDQAALCKLEKNEKLAGQGCWVVRAGMKLGREKKKERKERKGVGRLSEIGPKPCFQFSKAFLFFSFESNSKRIQI
jgi:hypothetical protein